MMVYNKFQRATRKGLPMKAVFKLLTLALLLANVPATASEPIQMEPNTSEPIKCYARAGGRGLTVGQSVTLCSGTADASKTIECFEKAWAHPGDGGLGLTAGQAITLCKTNSLE